MAEIMRCIAKRMYDEYQPRIWQVSEDITCLSFRVDDSNTSCNFSATYDIIILINQDIICITLGFISASMNIALNMMNNTGFIMSLISHANNENDIGCFKYIFDEKTYKYQCTIYYTLLPSDSFRATIHDHLSLSLLAVRKFMSTFIRITLIVDLPTISIKSNNNHHLFKSHGQAYDISFVNTAPDSSEINPIILPESKIGEWKNISKDFARIVTTNRYPSLFDPDKIGCFRSSNDQYYYKETKCDTLSDLKIKRISINSDSLFAFCNTLKRLSEDSIQFSKFPSKSIEIIQDQNLVQNFRLNPSTASNYLSANTLSRLEYSRAFDNFRTRYLLKVLNIHKDQFYTPSPKYKLPLASFKLQEIDNVESFIGKGGFGTVYRNTYNGSPVAIKLANLDRNDGKDEKLKHEFCMMCELNHTNVIKTIGYVIYAKRFGIVMEYLPRGSLSMVVKELTPFHPLQCFEKKINVLTAIAQGIKYLHSRDYAHFDLKPQNIYMTEDLSPIIADFGLTEAISPNVQAHVSGMSMYYSPPEQITRKSADLSADIWSFGMIMYHLLMEKNPFNELRELLKDKGEGAKRRYHAFINDELRRPLIPELFENEHPRAVALMRQCWINSNKQRPSIDEVLEELQRM